MSKESKEAVFEVFKRAFSRRLKTFRATSAFRRVLLTWMKIFQRHAVNARGFTGGPVCASTNGDFLLKTKLCVVDIIKALVHFS